MPTVMAYIPYKRHQQWAPCGLPGHLESKLVVVSTIEEVCLAAQSFKGAQYRWLPLTPVRAAQGPLRLMIPNLLVCATASLRAQLRSHLPLMTMLSPVCGKVCFRTQTVSVEWPILVVVMGGGGGRQPRVPGW